MFTTALMLAAATNPSYPPPEVQTRSDSRSYSWSWSDGSPPPPALMFPFDKLFPPAPDLPTMPALPAWPLPPMKGVPLLDPLPGFPADVVANMFKPSTRQSTGWYTRSSSTDVKRKNDEFTAKLTDKAGTIEVSGKVVDDQPTVSTVTVKATGKTPVTYSAAEVPESRKQAVKWLLKQVR
jgi:hypothetical protein